MIINDTKMLNYPFITMVDIFLDVVKKKYPNVAIFESLRTKARQRWLVAMGKSRTMNSKHLL